MSVAVSDHVASWRISVESQSNLRPVTNADVTLNTALASRVRVLIGRPEEAFNGCVFTSNIEITTNLRCC